MHIIYIYIYINILHVLQNNQEKNKPGACIVKIALHWVILVGQSRCLTKNNWEFNLNSENMVSPNPMVAIVPLGPTIHKLGASCSDKPISASSVDPI